MNSQYKELSTRISQLTITVGELTNEKGKLPSQTVAPTANVSSMMGMNAKKPEEVIEKRNAATHYSEKEEEDEEDPEEEEDEEDPEEDPDGEIDELEDELAEELDPDLFPEQLPPPDPFLVTMEIKKTLVGNCLVDSGAYHNLLPKSVYEKLKHKLPKLRPERERMSFADDSVKYSEGWLKDVVFTVHGCPMKLNFVVLDMNGGKGSQQTLLGRSFCATTQAGMDFCKGILTLRYPTRTLRLDRDGDLIQGNDDIANNTVGEVKQTLKGRERYESMSWKYRKKTRWSPYIKKNIAPPIT